MSEADFKQQAKRFDGINVVYYPPNKPNQRPILQTLEVVKLGTFHITASRWTDGGSIPSLGRAVAAPLGYLFRAFLIHDTALFDGLGWTESNKRFNEAIKMLEAPTWQRLAVMSAVKTNAGWQKTRAWFGWSAQYVE